MLTTALFYAKISLVLNYKKYLGRILYMYCKNCGKELNDNTKFCPNCGTPQNEENVTPNITHTNGTVQGQNEQKSKLIAGLLGIFLGGLGIHNFYLGYTNKAVLDIVLSLFCGIGAVWGLIEGIMILTGNISVDANGVPLKE